MKNNRKQEEHALRMLALRFWNGAPAVPAIIDVVGIEDMVRRSAFTKGSLYVFAQREDFPAPVARKGKTLLWQRTEFEKWLDRKRAMTRGASRYENA